MGIGGVPSQEDIERAAQGAARQWDDGQYTVVGLKWFDDEQHTDNGQPIYVPQQGELVARARLLVKGEEDDGPPISVRPGQIVALARALGAEVDRKWPDSIKDSSRFLTEVERAVEKADKEVEVTVSGGWVSDVPGWSLPRDQSFQLVYSGCETKDEGGNLTWRDYGYGRSVIFKFKIIGDLDGDSTPYDGWEERIFVPYRVAPDPENPDMPTFVIDEGDDGRNTAQVNCYNLIQAMCPALLENEGWSDVNNVVPEWDQFAREASVILKGDTIWSKRANKVKLPIWMIKQRYKDGRSVEEEEAVEEQEEEVIEQAPSVEHLYQAMTEEVRKRTKKTAKAFGPDGKLNKAGIDIAREVFAPLIEKKELPGNVFAEWSDEHVVIALEAMGYKDIAKMVQENNVEKPDEGADF